MCEYSAGGSKKNLGEFSTETIHTEEITLTTHYFLGEEDIRVCLYCEDEAGNEDSSCADVIFIYHEYEEGEDGTYKLKQKIRDTTNWIRSVFAQNKLLFTTGYDRMVRVYRRGEDGLYTKIQKIIDAEGRLLNVFATNNQLITAGEEGIVRIYESVSD